MENKDGKKSTVSINIEGNSFNINSLKITASFSDFPDTPIEALPFDYMCAIKNALTYSSSVASKLILAKVDYGSELSKEIENMTEEEFSLASNMEELSDNEDNDMNDYDYTDNDFLDDSGFLTDTDEKHSK